MRIFKPSFSCPMCCCFSSCILTKTSKFLPPIHRAFGQIRFEGNASKDRYQSQISFIKIHFFPKNSSYDVPIFPRDLEFFRDRSETHSYSRLTRYHVRWYLILGTWHSLIMCLIRSTCIAVVCCRHRSLNLRDKILMVICEMVRSIIDTRDFLHKCPEDLIGMFMFLENS